MKGILTKNQIDELLHETSSGCLAMVGTDGLPYAVPVHFSYNGEAVYIHCAGSGRKLDCIKNNPNVGMTVYKMDGLRQSRSGDPCNTGTNYRSVIITGRAVLIEKFECKVKALNSIIAKYTPQLSGAKMPDEAVKITTVIKIEISEIFGKCNS